MINRMSVQLCIVLLLLMILYYICIPTRYSRTRAIATFDGQNDIKGTVRFHESSTGTKITVKLQGVSDGLHGFHIHTKGDLSDECVNVCDHYNPFNVDHGGLIGGHVGDLGNVLSINGKVDQVIVTPKIHLYGPYSVIGRSIVIHERPDDLGHGNNSESKKTGNSGKRIGCAVIGLV